MSNLPPNLSKSTSSLAFIPDDKQSLSEELTRLAGHINAAQYRFLKLLAALVERNAWEGAGLKSPAHWLNYYCGIDLGAAREKVRVAKSLQNLPGIDAAFQSGAISYSKVRAMTRSATPENEAMLLQVARHGTAQHVEQLVRKYRRASRISDVQHDRDCYEGRELNCYFDDDGMLVIHGRLVAEEGAAFLNVLNVIVSAMNPPVTSHAAEAGEGEGGMEGAAQAQAMARTSQKTFPQKRADALVAMAEQAVSSLDEGINPLEMADKVHVVVHVEPAQVRSAQHQHDTDHDQSNMQSAPHTDCSLECAGSHFPLSPATVRRMTCDSSLLPILQDSRGNVLNIGRRTRAISPTIRRALFMRDGGCRFPGCCESRFVDAHHVKHWCDGGETSLNNLVLLCRHHHRLLHNEHYQIVKNAKDQFEFHSPSGQWLPYALPQQFEPEVDMTQESLAIEREHQAQGLQINACTAATSWQGERMDYDMAVGAMLTWQKRGPVSAWHPGSWI